MDRNAIAEWLNQALERHRAGALDSARELYRKILEVAPDNVDATYLLGLAAHQQGDYPQALRILEQACRLAPASAAIHTALGNVHRESGAAERALACYREALRLAPGDADAWYNLGIAHHERGELAAAIEAYSAACASTPAHAESWINLGVALKANGRTEEAEQCYAKALAAQPRHATAWFNLGVLHADALRFEQAIECYRRALEAEPARADAAYNIGVSCKSLGALEDAADWFGHALALNPNHLGALQNLGAVQYELGRFEQAEQRMRHALALVPDNPEANYSLSLVALARGDYRQGWEGYEWRWLGAENCRQHRRAFAQPLWQGEPLEGRTILLHAEQGLGDTLQFVRYAPLVAARGARVVLECQAPLARLLQCLPGIERVIARGEPLPPFDLHCPLLSLPRAFGTRLDTIPAALPYLRPDPALVREWQGRLGTLPGLKVGLTWAGNPRESSLHLNQIDRRRSLRLEWLGPLARVGGVSFVSLQLGAAAAEARSGQTPLRLADHTAAIADFADTAALVANLDLVISVDTSVAHLAGAIGKPVWLLSRFDACWRWMRGRDDSPWYPGMRLFRQPRLGEWGEVIERVASELGDSL